MIDLRDLPPLNGDISQIRLLVLKSGLPGGYCTGGQDWAELLCKIHPGSTMIPYQEIYQRQGCRGLQALLQRTVEEKAVNCLFIDGLSRSEFDVPFLETLRSKVFIVAAFSDSALLFFESHRYLAQAVDLALTQEYHEKHLFPLYGTPAHYWPTFTGPEDYFSLETSFEEKDIELSFVGRIDRTGRGDYFSHLRSNGLSPALFGDGTPSGRISKEEMISVYRRSKIGLNFSGVFTASHHESYSPIERRLRHFKGRLWELAYTKNLILTEYSPGLENVFRIGSELDVFSEPEDLVEKIRFYQRDDERRKEVALKGYQKARSVCDPYEIGEKLLRVIAAAVPAKRYRPTPLYLDGNFLKLQAQDRAGAAAYHIAHGRWSVAVRELGAIYRSRQFDWSSLLKAFVARMANQMHIRHPALFSALKRLRRLFW